MRASLILYLVYTLSLMGLWMIEPDPIIFLMLILFCLITLVLASTWGMR